MPSTLQKDTTLAFVQQKLGKPKQASPLGQFVCLAGGTVSFAHMLHVI